MQVLFWGKEQPWFASLPPGIGISRDFS